MIFKPQKVICHHSLTRDSGSVSWGAIRKFHMETLDPPYKDIGYHCGVELVKSGEDGSNNSIGNDTTQHVNTRGERDVDATHGGVQKIIDSTFR